MSQQTTGLSPGTQRIMGVIVGSLIGFGTILPGMAQSSGIVLPPWVYLMIGIAAFVAYNIKTQYGVQADLVAASSGPKVPPTTSTGP